PPPGLLQSRAQSMDNFAAYGLLPPPPPGAMGPPFPPPTILQKRFSSQADLSGPMPPQWMPPFPPPPPPPGYPRPPYPPPGLFGMDPKLAKKAKNGKGSVGPTRSLLTDKTSISSGKGSRRSREATHFEEERPPLIEGFPPLSKQKESSGKRKSFEES